MDIIPLEWDVFFVGAVNRLLMINPVINKQVKLYF
jgi:hypothetical protein